jgi:hypothetical protein
MDGERAHRLRFLDKHEQETWQSLEEPSRQRHKVIFSSFLTPKVLNHEVVPRIVLCCSKGDPFMRQILFASMLLLISAPAYAAGPAPQPTPQQATRIETDQKTGAIRFIVDGREVARFEHDGLHVRGNIAYTGEIDDIGQGNYDKPKPKR